MPLSWILADSNFARPSLNRNRFVKASKEFSEQVKDLIHAQGDAYDRLITESEESHDKRLNSWYLYSIRSQLAVTSSGTIGILALKGGSAVELRWFKSNDNSRFTEYESEQGADEGSDAIIRSFDKPQKIDKALQIIVERCHASGKILNKQQMLSNLRKLVQKNRSMLNGLKIKNRSSWYPYRYRVRIGFDAQGKVMHFLSTGADLVLRFDFELGGLPDYDEDYPTDQQSAHSFRNLVDAVSTDMDTLLRIETPHQRWRIKNFQIIVGHGASGNIGIAKAAGLISGRVYFKRDQQFYQNFMPRTFKIKDQTPLNILDYSFSNATNTTKSAKELQLTGETTPINRKQFRSHLKKSAKISQFFIRQSEKSEQKYWKLGIIRTDFSISLSGSIGVSTISQFGELRIEYEKIGV